MTHFKTENFILINYLGQPVNASSTTCHVLRFFSILRWVAHKSFSVLFPFRVLDSGQFPGGHFDFVCFIHYANTHGNAAALFIISLRQNIRVAVCKLFIVQLNASVVRWLYRRSLSASGGCCDFSSSIYLPFGASRSFMHGAVVMACIESKVTK